MGKERVQTRVDPDTNDQIETFAEDNNLSQSEAVRRIIRAGLANQGYPVAAADGGRVNTESLLERIASRTTVTLSTVLLALGTTFLLGGYLLVQQNLIYGALVALLFGYGLIIGATIALGAATVAQIALSRPLRGLIINLDGETA